LLPRTAGGDVEMLKCGSPQKALPEIFAEILFHASNLATG